MQKSVERLKALGQMPDARRDDPTEETLERYDQLLSEVETPLSYEEAEALVGVFPEGGLMVWSGRFCGWWRVMRICRGIGG